MAREPWFKMWAGDYLTDSDVQKLPLEAQGLLLRMWCACHIDGCIPSDPEELAVLIRCKLQSVLLSYPLCKQFFELRGGMLYSPRMEREKAKSAIARANAQSKHNKGGSAIGSANSSADGKAKSPAQKARKPENQKAEGKEEHLALSDQDRSQREESTVFQLPLVTGTEYGVPQILFDEYVRAYPGVSVMAELEKMRGWLISNPKNKKTRSGITRFMNSWLSRAQDRAPAVGGTNAYDKRTKSQRDTDASFEACERAKQIVRGMADRTANDAGNQQGRAAVAGTSGN